MNETDQQAQQVEVPADPRSDEIARSIGSSWARIFGQRPKSTSVEIYDGVVRCVIDHNADPGDDGVEAEAADAEAAPQASPEDPGGTRGFEQKARAAVASAMKRDVSALIPGHEKDSDVYTHTFILDRPRQKF